jgi:hypothetical protein
MLCGSNHGLNSGLYYSVVEIYGLMVTCSQAYLHRKTYIGLTHKTDYKSLRDLLLNFRTYFITLICIKSREITCMGEYLHRDPASRRRRRKGKSRIWDNKIGPRILRVSDPKMTALARASSNCKRLTFPIVREGVPNQQTRNCQTIIKIWS